MLGKTFSWNLKKACIILCMNNGWAHKQNDPWKRLEFRLTLDDVILLDEPDAIK